MFRDYHKVQRAVLETTLRLLIEKDLQATSMALISKESGVSTGSIYYYFKSKEEVVNELFRAIVRFYNEAIYTDFNREGSIRERFWRFWENVIRFNMEYPYPFQFLEQYSFSPYIDEAIRQEANRESCGRLAALYTEATEQKLFSAFEPRHMVLMHFGAIAHLEKAYLARQEKLTDEAIQSAIQFCWNAVSLNKAVV
ncbi:TetR/AcrR family transcriptional regulator [Paenibacillus sp. FSL R10-2736]|uniref:TetR/AcrR family transcriptional regulator n=1 Tax=Paenibacillus sp. FSL R10-2736 TaxID=2954692 RepID=UPI0030F8A18C